MKSGNPRGTVKDLNQGLGVVVNEKERMSRVCSNRTGRNGFQAENLGNGEIAGRGAPGAGAKNHLRNSCGFHP